LEEVSVVKQKKLRSLGMMIGIHRPNNYAKKCISWERTKINRLKRNIDDTKCNISGTWEEIQDLQ